MKKEQVTLKKLYRLYKGICQLSFEKIPYKDACAEHIKPNGGDGYTNVILVSKYVNKNK